MQVRCRPGRQVPELLILLVFLLGLSPILWRTYRTFLTHTTDAPLPPGGRQHLMALGYSLMVLLVALALLWLVCTAVIQLVALLSRLRQGARRDHPSGTVAGRIRRKPRHPIRKPRRLRREP